MQIIWSLGGVYWNRTLLRRELMFGLITELVQKDTEIVTLLENYAPYVITEHFKTQSAEFLEHARTYIVRFKVLPATIETGQQLPTWKVFPQEFPAALQEEILIRRKQQH
jgi:hypothetical protein